MIVTQEGVGMVMPLTYLQMAGASNIFELPPGHYDGTIYVGSYEQARFAFDIEAGQTTVQSFYASTPC